jgi:hypothetical protein
MRLKTVRTELAYPCPAVALRREALTKSELDLWFFDSGLNLVINAKSKN